MGYRTGSVCIGNACNNADSYLSCTTLLETACDCSDSFYQWTCSNCTYNLDGSCSATKGSTMNINPKSLSAWEDCQNQYNTSTDMINDSLWFSVASSAIILVMFAVVVVTKYDYARFENLAAVLSIIFSIIAAILLSTGYSALPTTGTSCVTTFVDTLPGCTLNTAANSVLNNEKDAQAYLTYAYRNLLVSPAILFAFAIPDIFQLVYYISMKVINMMKKRQQ